MIGEKFSKFKVLDFPEYINEEDSTRRETEVSNRNNSGGLIKSRTGYRTTHEKNDQGRR